MGTISDVYSYVSRQMEVRCLLWHRLQIPLLHAYISRALLVKRLCTACLHSFKSRVVTTASLILVPQYVSTDPSTVSIGPGLAVIERPST